METELVQENELSKHTVAAIATVCVVVFLVIVALVVYYCYFAKRKGAPRFQCWPCKLPFPTCCSPFRKKTAKKQQKKQRQRERERKHEEIQALSREDALKELEGSRAAQNYEYALDYVNEHPPDESEGTLAEDDTEHVIEHGVNAWEFIPSYDNTNITVLDNTDVEFVGGEQSVMTNLQFPNEQRVYYFEVRLDRLPEGTNVAVGAAMHGYPPLRMAGWANNSVAYHSADGHVYYCHPLDITRKTTTALQSDTLGVGWRPHSGKMFFVINGAIMAHVRTPWINKRMYPIISADGPCNVSVNLGARAYVLSHANMRFWGLAAAEGARPPPPMYHQTQDTTLVASADNEHAGAHSGWRSSLGLRPPPAYEDSASVSDLNSILASDAPTRRSTTEELSSDNGNGRQGSQSSSGSSMSEAPPYVSNASEVPPVNIVQANSYIQGVSSNNGDPMQPYSVGQSNLQNETGVGDSPDAQTDEVVINISPSRLSPPLHRNTTPRHPTFC